MICYCIKRQLSQAPGYNTPGFFDALRGSYFKKVAHPYITKGIPLKSLKTNARGLKTAYRTATPSQPEQKSRQLQDIHKNIKYLFFKKNVGFLTLATTQKLSGCVCRKSDFSQKLANFNRGTFYI